jgi:hypothetical protein
MKRDCQSMTREKKITIHEGYAVTAKWENSGVTFYYNPSSAGEKPYLRITEQYAQFYPESTRVDRRNISRIAHYLALDWEEVKALFG